MARYDRYRILTNSSEYYKPLRDTRDLTFIRHYETPVMKNPSLADRMAVTSDSHLWKYGDRLYKLAYQYYGDARFWWVIAWYNLKPTDSHCRMGDIILIPQPLDRVLKYLGYQ